MKRTQESGAVSIFIVVFTALLVTVVTASFIQLMLRNQQQATNNDLSQSAYDSALAGVEDAKRALVKLKKCSGQACESQVRTALSSGNCDSLEAADIGINFGAAGEVQVGNPALNQAYTCVKVQLKTDTFAGNLGVDESAVIPLDTGGVAFNRIRVSWYSQEDLTQVDTNSDGILESVPATITTTPAELPSFDQWPVNQPSLMRAQLIQFSKGSINLSSFDSAGSANARTLFLYPQDGGASTLNFAADSRLGSSAGNVPQSVSCDLGPTSPAYLCSVVIDLPAMANREAYLQLAAFYKATHYSVTVLNGNTPVPFDGAQPIVDATGRASDLFRRVKARVSVSDSGSSLPFPDAALTINGNLCKNFFVTNSPDNYSPDTSCAPVPVTP